MSNQPENSPAGSQAAREAQLQNLTPNLDTPTSSCERESMLTLLNSLGFNLVWRTQVTSTMDLTKYIGENLRHGDILVADHQTGGLGTTGTQWLSTEQDVKFTWVIDPLRIRGSQRSPQEFPALLIAASVMAAVSACITCVPDSAKSELGSSLCFKLPNDLRVKFQQRYKKMGGVLAASGLTELHEKSEAKLSYRMLQNKGIHLPENFIYVGVGVNLADELVTNYVKQTGHVLIDGEYRPSLDTVTSLETLRGVLVNRAAFIRNYFVWMQRYLEMLDIDVAAFVNDMSRLVDPKAGERIVWYETDNPELRKDGTLLGWQAEGMHVLPSEGGLPVTVNYSRIARSIPLDRGQYNSPISG